MTANPKPQAHMVVTKECAKSIAAMPEELYGVGDIIRMVDSRSPAVLAAEEASASKIRVEMLRGQTRAEEERYAELNQRAVQALNDELQRVQEAGR